MQKDNRGNIIGDHNHLYQDVKVIIENMVTGEKISVPKYLTNTPAPPPETFVGRDEALKKVHERLQNNQRLLLASGIRGIGKTTLAQAYWHAHLGDYDCMAWVNCPNGILQGLLECDLHDTLHFEAINDNWERHRDRLWKHLVNLKGKHLLVLDNANDGAEVLRYVQSLNHWTILLTTTADVDGLPQEKVEHLREDAAIKLFCSHYQAAEGQTELLKRLLLAIGYHTLTIELLAKNLAELPRYSLQQLCDDLTQRGVLHLPKTREVNIHTYHQMLDVNPKDVIREIFNLATLPDTAYERLLFELAMLPTEPLPYDHLYLLMQINDDTEAAFDQALKKLCATGWLERDRTAHTYRLHNLIAEVVRDKHHPTYARCRALVDTLEALLDDETITLGDKLSYLPYAQSLAQRLPDAELAGLYLSAYQCCRESGYLQLGELFAKEALKRYELLDNQYWMAGMHQKLGDTYIALGKYEAAIESFEKFNKGFETLYKENPNDEDIKNGLAISYSKLGELWQNKGDFNQALDFFEKETTLSEALFQANPHNENLKRGLAISYEKLGDLWQEKGDFNQALDFFEKETSLFEELFQANPHSENLKNGLAISYSKLGVLWQNKGDFNQALDFFEKQTILFEELYQANPHNENLKNGLAISYNYLGNIWKEKENFDEALKYFEKYQRISEETYNANPYSEKLKNDLSISYFKLGNVWRAQGDLEKAKAYLEKDLQLTEAIAAANPQSFNWQNNLRISYQNVASLYEDLERPSEALAWYQKEEAILSVLWEQTKLDALKEDLDRVRERIASR